MKSNHYSYHFQNVDFCLFEKAPRRLLTVLGFPQWQDNIIQFWWKACVYAFQSRVNLQQLSKFYLKNSSILKLFFKLVPVLVIASDAKKVIVVFNINSVLIKQTVLISRVTKWMMTIVMEIIYTFQVKTTN